MGRTADSDVPALVKRRQLVRLLREHSLSQVVETGTFLGDTTYYLATRGFQVTSLEVEPKLAAAAKRRFTEFPQVSILEGDSGELMLGVVEKLHSPALFWLDGHYSGGFTGKGELETPVVKEALTIITKAPAGSVVLIDDARCFGKLPDYPNLSDFKNQLKAAGVDHVMRELDALMFIVPDKEARRI